MAPDWYSSDPHKKYFWKAFGYPLPVIMVMHDSDPCVIPIQVPG